MVYYGNANAFPQIRQYCQGAAPSIHAAGLGENSHSWRESMQQKLSEQSEFILKDKDSGDWYRIKATCLGQDVPLTTVVDEEFIKKNYTLPTGDHLPQLYKFPERALEAIRRLQGSLVHNLRNRTNLLLSTYSHASQSYTSYYCWLMCRLEGHDYETVAYGEGPTRVSDIPI